jgi:hypothetical protein
VRIRNFVLLCGGCALLIAIVTVLVAGLARPTEPSAAGSTASSPAQTPMSRYDPTAGDAARSDEDQPAEVQENVWGPVVDSFARNFTNTAGGAGPWRERLIGNSARPNVTTAVSAQLHSVDVRNVPAGHYTGRQVLKSSAYELGIKVSYREGWAMVLYLNTDGSKWQIYAYDKLEP